MRWSLHWLRTPGKESSQWRWKHQCTNLSWPQELSSPVCLMTGEIYIGVLRCWAWRNSLWRRKMFVLLTCFVCEALTDTITSRTTLLTWLRVQHQLLYKSLLPIRTWSRITLMFSLCSLTRKTCHWFLWVAVERKVGVLCLMLQFCWCLCLIFQL